MSQVDLPGSTTPPLDLALLDQLPAAVYCCDALVRAVAAMARVRQQM